MAKVNYQYETSPRKLEPDYNKKSKKQKEEKRKKIKIVKDLPRQEIKISEKQKKKQIKLTLFVLAGIALLFTISYQNSQINVKFSQIQSQKQELATLEKENEQTEVNIESSSNLSNIEKLAKEKLGMSKLTNKQTVYVTLPKKDYVESASEQIVIDENQDNDNWFVNFIEKIFGKK